MKITLFFFSLPDLSIFENKSIVTNSNNQLPDESLIIVPKSKKRIIYDTSSSSDKSISPSQRCRQIIKKPRKRQKCAFVLDECDVSGDESSDDENDEGDISDLVANTMICVDGDDIDTTAVDMHAKYLQSLK